MKHGRWSVLLVTFLLVVVPLSFTQIDTLVIPAGTPEDQGLQAITKEPDDQKKAAMYEDFLKQFASNPQAVIHPRPAPCAKTCRRRSITVTRPWPARHTASIFWSRRPASPSR